MVEKADDATEVSRTGWQRVLGHLLAEHGSLRQKAIRSSVWVLLGNALSQLATLARTIVLARLLSPNDFGLMGIATIALGGLNAFTQTGYDAALVHRPGDIRRHLDTVFSIQSLRGLVLAGLLYLVSPAIAGFFRNPDAIPVLRAIGIALLIQGFANPATVFFQKELNFKRQVFWTLSDTVTALVVGITLAILLRNVWALVGAYIAGVAAKTAMSYVMQDYRPRPRIQWDSARDLTRYGKWVFGTNILGYISTNLDVAIVGRILGTTSVGLYQTAFRISNLHAAAMAQIVSSVAFPVYAKVQTDQAKLRRVFFSGLDAALLTGLPIALLFTVLARPATVLVLGRQWLDAAPALQLLAFYGFFRLIAALGGVLFAGVGHPASDTKMNIMRFAVLAALIYPFTMWWGLPGAAWAALSSMAAPLPYWLARCAGYLGVSPGRIICRIGASALPVLIGFAAPLLALALLLPVDRVWAFLATSGSAFLIYGLVAYRRVKALASGGATTPPGSQAAP